MTGSRTIYIMYKDIIVFDHFSNQLTIISLDGDRTDDVLRAMNLKPGEHEVVLTFKPQSIRRTETVAYVASLLLLLAVVGGIFVQYRKKNNTITKQ